MLLDRIAAEVDARFTNWAFRGSLVDWHYHDGQVFIKDFDIVTSDQFEPRYVCPFWGPRISWKFMGRSIDVFYESDPGPRMQSIEDRIKALQMMAEKYPNRRQKSMEMIDRYNTLLAPQPMFTKPISLTCPHRGDQIETVICDQCGQGKGQPKPVYSCALHGRCTHRLERRGQESQDPPIRTCIGCEDGPWPKD